MFEPFGTIRVAMMKGLIRSCNPEHKIVVDLGAGNPAISDGIDCSRRIKLDINPASNPDYVCDLTKGIPLEDSSVDICVASEILEHIYTSKKLLDDIRRILKPGGNLILSSPNICSLKYRIAFMMGRIPAHAAKADCFYKVDKPGHIRDYNFDEMISLLRGQGFETVWSGTDGLSFRSKTFLPSKLLPKTFGDAIIIKARKRG